PHAAPAPPCASPAPPLLCGSCVKCSRCQQATPSPANFGLGCGAPVNGPAPIATSYVDLKDEVEGLRRSLREALEQQTATSEILRVIRSSPADLQPVLEAVARSAARLWGAGAAISHRMDGEVLRALANNR